VVLVLEVSAHILTIQAALREPRSIIATEFCKSCASARNYRMLSGPFRLHKDFMISGRLSLPPMSTFQDLRRVRARRREPTVPMSLLKVTVAMPVLRYKR
jgi:hypothetical protein